MIAYIKGILKQADADSVIVETGGLGYQIHVPVTCLNQCRLGTTIELYTHFVLKEDGAQLFGFLNSEELKLFKLILGVSGIGPKGAMAVLSALGAERFTHAVVAEDITTITKVPGIGKKTAQRLVIELKDKLARDSRMAAFISQGNSGLETGLTGEVMAAMEALGYSSTEIVPVLNKISKNIERNTPVEHVVKLVLKQLAAG